MYKEVEGNLIILALEGRFDVIAHGCNCMCQMGAGIAPQMAASFGCNKYPLEHKDYQGDINKLGQIDYVQGLVLADKRFVRYWQEHMIALQGSHRLTVVNAYTQYRWNAKGKPLDYEALTLCMRKMNHEFEGSHIGLPQIGAGLAGGNWATIKSIIQTELKDCDVTVVIYKP